jgi:phosphoenolpyruvate-protein kinase (PTS system EI component)
MATTGFSQSLPGIDQARARLGVLANKGGRLTEAEQAEYDRLQSFVNGVPSGGGSNNFDSIFRGQGDLLDKANAFTEKQMGLSHRYRGAEGAWQSQIDEQANRRIETDGNVKKRLQDNSSRLTEEAKQADARRAVINFRSNGRGVG